MGGSQSYISLLLISPITLNLKKPHRYRKLKVHYKIQYMSRIDGIIVFIPENASIENIHELRNILLNAWTGPVKRSPDCPIIILHHQNDALNEATIINQAHALQADLLGTNCIHKTYKKLNLMSFFRHVKESIDMGHNLSRDAM